MKIACIGCGVMGSAFMSAISKKVNPADITMLMVYLKRNK